MIVNTRNHKGAVFGQFFARRAPGTGPGWYVFGKAGPEWYGGRYIMMVARPDVKPQRHPHYNCEVRRGWCTQREARAVAAMLNAREADCAV